MNHTAIAAALRQIADALDEDTTPEAPVIAQPKLPEGYNPHRPGDSRPINSETWCTVFYIQCEECVTARKAKNWNWRAVAGYKIVPSPEKPKVAPQQWPWIPGARKRYYVSGVGQDSDSQEFTWLNDGVDKKLLAMGNVYQTEEEAITRAELDKRLAMTARLRQLGGGEEGTWVVRYDIYQKVWVAWDTHVFAPGEARFLDEETAEAAIETLRFVGLLPESWS